MRYKSSKMRVLNARYMGEGGIKAAMLSRYDNGMTYAQLAEHFGLRDHVVAYYMQQFLQAREQQQQPSTDFVSL